MSSEVCRIRCRIHAPADPLLAGHSITVTSRQFSRGLSWNSVLTIGLSRSAVRNRASRSRTALSIVAVDWWIYSRTAFRRSVVIADMSMETRLRYLTIALLSLRLRHRRLLGSRRLHGLKITASLVIEPEG